MKKLILVLIPLFLLAILAASVADARKKGTKLYIDTAVAGVNVTVTPTDGGCNHGGALVGAGGRDGGVYVCKGETGATGATGAAVTVYRWDAGCSAQGAIIGVYGRDGGVIVCGAP